MTVGTLATQAGVKIDTVRYYERHGLLPKASRTNSGYRIFPDASLERLRFIKQAQALGFTLNEVKQLLALRVSPETTCNDVRKRAEAKLADIQCKVDSLLAMKRALQQLVSTCESVGPASECSFLANLHLERPIACALGQAQFAERKRLVERLAKKATERQTLPNGVRLGFEAISGRATELAKFVDLERSCCPFLTFRIDAKPGERISLELTGPVAALQIIRELIPERISKVGGERYIAK